ncbi:MAG TPA: carboxypeptidase-like regulatory domain-containing protein [Pyrinomonadaceae bacterium]|nr:carboxypeptidase-like regulatory domain-containing protein [Pyrinomonadaceae bacterium]
MFTKLIPRFLKTTLIIAIAATALFGQQNRAALRGLITDEMGAAIVGASVTIVDANGQAKTTVSNNEGIYAFSGLAPGRYTLRATAKGFAASGDQEVELKAGQRPSFDLTLKVTIEEQQVTVAVETPVSTDASANANQTVISGKDLDALPDDPEELAAALQALAGPSMGPNGGQIFVDGFSGGSLPSKSSIREIRINQNPFAAENDQPSGRVDIFTKPGTDKLRGTAFLNFNDESLNSRNPFATASRKRTPFQMRQFGGSLSGPLVANKASYFVNFERREVNDNELVTVTALDPNLNRVTSGASVLTPRRFITFSPRVDYALNTNNTLIIRYTYNDSNLQNNGVGGFSLPERGFTALASSHNLQLTETAVINPTTLNETRFQFTRSRNEYLGDSSKPTLVVSGSFFGGSSQVGHFENTDQRWELSNFTAIQKGQHSYKIGGRLRGLQIDNNNPANFGGQYVFTGGLVPQLDANGDVISTDPIAVDSLERYRRNRLLSARVQSPTNPQGDLTLLDLRARGGGPAQFSINTGNPKVSVSQFDASVYGQDDWRVRPNITLSYGLRYEYQTNTHSPLNFAPRLAVAWSPGGANSARAPKMVIRAGFGVFYNRFGEAQTLLARRFDGVNQQQFLFRESPLYVPDQNGNLAYVPPTAGGPLDSFPGLPQLTGPGTGRQITYRVASDLTTPTIYGGGFQTERQLPYRFTMFAGIFMLQIQHGIRIRDINAPLPGSITQANPSGVRPHGNAGDIYQIESSARFKQRQIFIGFNNRFTRVVSFFGNYYLSHSNNDADGQGSGTFPANNYDLRPEYGRSGFDIRHRFTFGGTWTLPWGVTLNPFVLASSGAPFNIITGADTNGDGQFSERPSFAPAEVACNGAARPANVVCTQFGNFNLQPALGEPLIPRNYGQSPGYFIVNLTASKTWTFGSLHSGKSAANSTPKTQPGAAKSASGGAAPAKPATSGIPGLGPGGLGGGGNKEAKRYSMQFSLGVQNLLNRTNLQPPEGNLSSPAFGESLGLNGFGGFGVPGSAGAGNRRITGRIRLSF